MPESLDSSRSRQNLDAIVTQFRPKIFRIVFALVRERETAENLTQDCFLRACQAFGAFRGECRPDTWLVRIAINVVRDHASNRRFQFWKRTQKYGQQARELQDFLPDRSRSPEADVLRIERLQSIWAAAGRLSERQRTVFVLRFVEEMDLLEIAAATGIKEGTVKAHLFQAVQTIREQIGVRL